MSDNSNSVGCWDLLKQIVARLKSIWYWILAIYFGYTTAIGILSAILKVKSEELPTWAFFVALLLSVPVILITGYLLGGFLFVLEKMFNWLSTILKVIFTWLGTILIGALLLIVFVYLDLRLWISVTGLIFLVIGVLRTPVGGWKESAPEVINRLGAYFLGLVMIVVGIVKFFLDKGT